MASGDQHWSLVDTSYTRLINNAIDKATDAMGAVFAVHDSVNEQQFTTIQLEVEDVNSITRYRHIEKYLTELNAVEFARPLRVDGQKVMFEVLLRSEEKDFLNLIKNDAELTEIASPLVGNDIKPTAETPDIKAGDKIAEDLQLSASDTSVNLPQVPVYYYQLAR